MDILFGFVSRSLFDDRKCLFLCLVLIDEIGRTLPSNSGSACTMSGAVGSTCFDQISGLHGLHHTRKLWIWFQQFRKDHNQKAAPSAKLQTKHDQETNKSVLLSRNQMSSGLKIYSRFTDKETRKSEHRPHL